jgi:hypothetical protein
MGTTRVRIDGRKRQHCGGLGRALYIWLVCREINETGRSGLRHHTRRVRQQWSIKREANEVLCFVFRQCDTLATDRPTLLIGLVSFHGDSPFARLLFAQPSTATSNSAAAAAAAAAAERSAFVWFHRIHGAVQPEWNFNWYIPNVEISIYKQRTRQPLDRDDKWKLAAIQSSKSLDS